jgi:hypothetical protein
MAASEKKYRLRVGGWAQLTVSGIAVESGVESWG